MIFDNMGSIEVYLSLGSNLGERRKNIIEAISCLDNEFGTSYSRCSDIIETEPWGEVEGGTFLNCAICYTIPDAGQDIELYCNVILSKCKRIESALGRIGRPEYNIYGKRIYRARTIDIDILFYGDNRLSLPLLTIPHPLISKRDFVVIPLRQIASDKLIDDFPEIFEVK